MVLNRKIGLEQIDTLPHQERIGVGKGVAIDKFVAVDWLRQSWPS